MALRSSVEKAEDREANSGLTVQNGTRALRKQIRSDYEALGINVFFIGAFGFSGGCEGKTADRCFDVAENICDREDIVEANIRSVKISSPDVSSRPSRVLSPHH